MPENVCRSCGKPIEWAMTKKQTAMPLDPVPTPDGRLVVDAKGIVRPRTSDDDGVLEPRRSYHATCPASGRKGKK